MDLPILQNIVIVTGANGFLGQHIVKLLNEKDENLDQIICFDLVKYENKLDYLAQKPMIIINGDIRNKEDVLKATKGVKWIINCASLYESNNNDLESTNVDGVSVLINAAIYNNVPFLIQASTVDVCCGTNSNYYAAENTVTIPKKHILDKYSKSKYQAELIIGRANGKLLNNGYEQLRTVNLRLSLLYGEQDNYFLPMILQLAKDFRGTLIRIDNIYSRLQWCYVGNAAWSFLKTKDKMVTDKSIGGEEFFINDDTPLIDPFDFVSPYLESRKFKVSKQSCPYVLIQFIYLLLYFFLFLIKPIYNVKIPSRYDYSKISYLVTTHFFNRNKATLRLDYEPIYDPETSQSNCLDYYKNLSLK